MSLSAEKERILQSICTVLGETGLFGQPLPVSLPPLENELPQYIDVVESLELHLGIPCDRSNLKKSKGLSADLYLPRRGLYLELDREGHDFTEPRLVTLDYYPEGLPRGFRPEAYRAAILALGAAAPGGKMNAGRALADFAKDLCVEGVLDKPLVRLPKHELLFLLAKGPEEPKLAQLRTYLIAKAADLNLPTLSPFGRPLVSHENMFARSKDPDSQ